MKLAASYKTTEPHPNSLVSFFFFLFSHIWNFLFFISFLLLNTVSAYEQNILGINETYFETVESKYRNQAIEIYNETSSVVDLSFYNLIAGKIEVNHNVQTFVGSRTNSIVTWSLSKQEDFTNTFFRLSFSSLLPPGETAVILDPGYRFEEYFGFTNIARSNTIYLLTTSSGVLGTGNFMKVDDVIRLVSTHTMPHVVIDEFHNQASAQGYGTVKINRSQKGLSDNTSSRFQTIGYIESLENLYTTLPPDRLSLDEINGNPMIVGLPQVHNLTCKYLTTVSQLCNQVVRFKKHDYIKMYHYPHGSANLITDADDILLTSGQSDPITLFALEPGLHKISTTDNSFPILEKTPLHFNHSLSDKVFITEIFYNTNKDLTWIEVYSQSSITLPLQIRTFNSSYKENNNFNLSNQTLEPGYNVLGYRNQNFNKQFPLSEPITPIPYQFDITTKGTIALSSVGEYLDIVHYDKNWFDDIIEGRSLQRVALQNYAFTKNEWGVSTEVNSTPFSANIFTRDISFTVDLISDRLPLSTLKINFLADFNVSGTLSAYLYNSMGYRIGKVLSQDVGRSYRAPLFVCLKEVDKRFNLTAGNYSLMFLFNNSEGNKILYRKFILE